MKTVKLTNTKRRELISFLNNNEFQIIELGYYADSNFYNLYKGNENKEIVINQLKDNKCIDCIEFTEGIITYKTFYLKVVSILSNRVIIYKTTISIEDSSHA